MNNNAAVKKHREKGKVERIQSAQTAQRQGQVVLQVQTPEGHVAVSAAGAESMKPKPKAKRAELRGKHLVNICC